MACMDHLCMHVKKMWMHEMHGAPIHAYEKKCGCMKCMDSYACNCSELKHGMHGASMHACAKNVDA